MFTSTRSKTSVSASKAILKGLSEDGGLFVFKDFNQTFFSKDLLELTYEDLTVKIFDSLLEDFNVEDIKTIVNKSYNLNNFPKETVSIKDNNTHAYLELYNGQTFAFKDMALSILPKLFSHSKKIQGITKKTVILTATSGDTGSAALSGFSDLDDTYVIVLYPSTGVSEFQELQMTEFQSDKHIVLAVDGNFDDCQKTVKEIFNTLSPVNILLSSANSINIGRIIPQIVYYFYTYNNLVNKGRIEFGEEINVTVPTGNFGNIYAAYVAKKMGVPIHKLVIASNENNILTDLFNSKEYDLNRPLHKTISPSMDILISSNLERYLFELYDGDTSKVSERMNDLKDTGKTIIDKLNKENCFYASFTSESDTKKQINTTLRDENYLIDPHTAVAKSVSTKYIEETNDTRYMVVVSTANPYKFSDAILDALDLSKEGTLKSKFERIEKKSKTKADERMLSILYTKPKRIEVSLNDVHSYVEKVIGEINDKN